MNSEAKEIAWRYLDRNAAAIAELGDAIFYFGELGLEEVETAGMMTELLREGGFYVEKGLSGFPTAFLATSGEAGPVVAIHTEYDANPDNSQVPGIAEKREIVAGAPGHCEGHNVNAAVMVAAALAVRHAQAAARLPGRLKVFGAPAEEMILARPYFVRDGHFDDVDIAFHPHIYDRFSTEYGQIQIAAYSVEFTFFGESAHAGTSPWAGRDALDAVVLMDAGFAQHREHMRPEMRAHRVITNGGAQPNVIPDRASIWWYFRDRTADGARALFQTAKRIADGAALMTGTRVEVDVRSAVWPVRANQTLAELLQRNIDAVGMPTWTSEEDALARRIQQSVRVAADGLRRKTTPLEGPSEPIMASNDCGDISWKVPMGRLWFPGNVPGLTFHHWSAGAALATSISHKGALAGAKALAGAVLDCLEDTALIQQAQRTHRSEVAGISYEPLLPSMQVPRLDTNRAVMDRFRPLMQQHYRQKRPRFEI